MKTNTTYDFSYFQLTLLDFLKESHPKKADDVRFVKEKAKEAMDTYLSAIHDGYISTTAQELANEVLFKGLLFSKHDMLVSVLWNEFPDIIAHSEAKEFAVKIENESEIVFSKYYLSDDFDYSPEYDKLYTELTGFIDIWLEEHEL